MTDKKIEAPERIWAITACSKWTHGHWNSDMGAEIDPPEMAESLTEYVRADLTEAPGNTDPIAKYDDELRSGSPAPVWRDSPISTKERLPEKPGKRSYEHVRCLIFIKGEWEVGMWNCEHLVWDDDYGDDFRYQPTEPSHWMPLPLAPDTHPTPQPEAQPDAVREAAREALVDTVEEIIAETHEIDVTDRNYAENVISWLELHHPAALRALTDQVEAPDE